MNEGVQFTSSPSVQPLSPPATPDRPETRPEAKAAGAVPEARPVDHRVGKIEQLRRAAEEAVSRDNVRLSIIYDEPTERFVYRGLDPDTGEVVRQYPTDELLERAARLRELRGITIDRSL